MTATRKPSRGEEIAVTVIAAPFGAVIAWSTYYDLANRCMALRFSSVCAETEPAQFWVRIALGVVVSVGSLWFSYYNARRLIRSRNEWR